MFEDGELVVSVLLPTGQVPVSSIVAGREAKPALGCVPDDVGDC